MASVSMPRQDLARPRGRTTAYCLFVQLCREEHKKNHPGEDVAYTDFNKKCSERWKTMSDQEKERFVQMAEQDNLRYGYEQPAPKRRKQMKDPNAPKRALTAFILYSNDHRNSIREANPDLPVTEVSRELGRRWGSLDPSVKKQYEDRANLDKERYQREMADYRCRVHLAPGPAAPQVQQQTLQQQQNGAYVYH